MHAKTVRIQDHHYQPEPQGSQSTFVSNEFVEEDDYYSAHLGATAEDMQEESKFRRIPLCVDPAATDSARLPCTSSPPSAAST